LLDDESSITSANAWHMDSQEIPKNSGNRLCVPMTGRGRGGGDGGAGKLGAGRDRHRPQQHDDGRSRARRRRARATGEQPACASAETPTSAVGLHKRMERSCGRHRDMLLRRVISLGLGRPIMLPSRPFRCPQHPAGHELHQRPFRLPRMLR